MIASDDSLPTATVVGAGPAGLIVAEVLAEAGFAVTVYEHKPSAGRKFLLAGRGGLNITHSEPFEQFVQRYGKSQARLEAVLSEFAPAELRAWCADLDEPTFAGSSGRVFPESFRATPLLRAWLKRLARSGVELETRHRWLGFGAESDPGASRFTDSGGENIIVHSDVTIMALGGASWPRTGSDAAWVDPFTAAGIDVVPLEAANCGVQVAWTSEFLDRFEGRPLKNVALSVTDTSVRGDCVVTAKGLEGGPVYAHSAELRAGIAEPRTVTLSIDMQPDLSIDQLIERLARRRSKESTSTWLRKAGFGPIQVSLLREVTANAIPTEPAQAAELIKTLPLKVEAMMPIERAISSAGGVSFDELDQNFMLHKLPGVFVAGEMLDWEAPTGGYLLQGCFSTAVAAARGAAEWHRRGIDWQSPGWADSFGGT